MTSHSHAISKSPPTTDTHGQQKGRSVSDIQFPLRRPSRRQRKNPRPASEAFYCSWGKHRTFKHRDLKEEYEHGTICMKCQIDIMGNLEKFVAMPEMSEAMYREARRRTELAKQEVLQENRRLKADPDSTGYVYYMRINGQIKIGYTANLRQRSRNYPPGTELVATEPGTLELERRRHTQFSRDLARGREWFRESEQLTTHMRELVGTHGVPDALMYRYRKHEGAKTL